MIPTLKPTQRTARRMKRASSSGMQRPFGWMTLQILVQKLLLWQLNDKMERLEITLKDEMGKLTLKLTCGRRSARRWQQWLPSCRSSSSSSHPLLLLGRQHRRSCCFRQSHPLRMVARCLLNHRPLPWHFPHKCLSLRPQSSCLTCLTSCSEETWSSCPWFCKVWAGSGKSIKGSSCQSMPCESSCFQWKCPTRGWNHLASWRGGTCRAVGSQSRGRVLINCAPVILKCFIFIFKHSPYKICLFKSLVL